MKEIGTTVCVIRQYCFESSGRMELISTIIFVMCENGTRLEPPQIVQRVNAIKPHFSKDVVSATVDEISEILNCVSCGTGDT